MSEFQTHAKRSTAYRFGMRSETVNEAFAEKGMAELYRCFIIEKTENLTYYHVAYVKRFG